MNIYTITFSEQLENRIGKNNFVKNNLNKIIYMLKFLKI